MHALDLRDYKAYVGGSRLLVAVIGPAHCRLH